MAELLLTAKERYSQLDADRSDALDRARECAKVSLPYVLRDEGDDSGTEYPNNYVRGFVSLLVSNLSGKLSKTILPSTQPMHRLVPSKEALYAISQGDADKEAEIYKMIAEQDEMVLRHISKSGFRKIISPLMDFGQVTGNGLVERTDSGFRLFAMDTYVVNRDPKGNILEVIIEELLKYEELPEEIQKEGKEGEEYQLYTRMYKEEGKFIVHQELNGEVLAGTEKSYNKVSDRFVVLAWDLLHGENYGRGHIYRYKDTIDDLNNHLQALSESAIINTKHIFTVNPNGMTKYKDFVNTDSGDAIIGSADDIGVIRTEKHNDMKMSLEIVRQYKEELSKAFLFGAGSVRDSERTTKYEVQVLMNEIEGTQSGIYTSLASQIQEPLVDWALADLKIDLGDEIEVDIISGSEALGKNIEILKTQDLLENLGKLAQLVGAEAIKEQIDVRSVVSSMVANSGVSSKNFIYSKQQIDATKEAEQQAMMAQQAMNPALQQAGATAGQQIMGGNQ